MDIEARSSWFAVFTANIGEAITRAFDLTFDTLVRRDEMPTAPSADTLFSQNSGSVTHDQRLEYLSLHGIDGERFSLSQNLIDLVKTVFGEIRDLAKRWKAQSVELVEARRSAWDLEQRVQDTQRALSAAQDQLDSARKKTAEAQELATRAYDDHAELSYEYTKLDQALEPIRPAYSALQAWLADIQKAVPNGQDHHLAERWIGNWLNDAPQGAVELYKLTFRLQNPDYRTELLRRVNLDVSPDPNFSSDIRTRWDEIASLSVQDQRELVLAMRDMNYERKIPRSGRKEAETALAHEIAKMREAKSDKPIPPLARQFLDLPESAQEKIGEAIEAQDKYKKQAKHSAGPSM
ncbi:hypothetical protein [Aliiroseovarius sp. 2305UL8-7]|uniref:hypothetical protein n=1 Tax=Aliiroseovarius conchicola TaxID=3121637 RepID=UPI0035278DCA